MKKLLEVKDLHVTFSTHEQKLHAVRGVSFDLFEGETLGIVGESACGKSTMAKALLRLTPSHCSTLKGEVWYGGADLLKASEKQMQKVRGKEMGMIFQDPMTSLNPTLKIGAQIVEGYLRHYPHLTRQAAFDYAIQMLGLVGIPEPEVRAQEYPHTLSGGMRQRAMIALALASNPKLLIADEPTTALDVTIQAQILDLMKTIQKQMRMSIILITHDLSVVAGLCDRVLVMYAGQIIESAPVQELFSSPQHPYTKRLFQSIPRLDMLKDQPLVPIEGSPPNLIHPAKGCGFCPRCPAAMNICRLESPPSFQVKEGHHSSCFHHDPRRHS
jgi:oligopeptide transport system ATP-binding protein